MRRSRRVILASFSVLAVLVSVMAAGAPAEGASSSRSTTVPVRLVHRTGPLRAIAGSSSASATDTRATDRLDAKLFRLHTANENEDALAAYARKLSSVSTSAGVAPSSGSVPVSSHAAGVVSRFQGSNQFDNRYSDGGNQFSVEPPDQGMCTGNGQVIDIVNTVMQVYTTNGTPLIQGNGLFPEAGPVGLSLNQFFGLPSSFVRPSGPFGPFSTDPSCYFDQPSGRWIAVMLELDLDATTGDFAGPSALYIAVSDTSDATGSWNVYTVDTTNNGENGTPDHHCSSGFCYGDYPQIGADANGFYVTTNEFDNLGAGEFHAGQLYAFSKADLLAGVASPTMVYLQNIQSDLGIPSYTLQPVNATPDQWDSRNGGTQYFGMSLSPFIDQDQSIDAIDLWALTNTSSLNGGSPDVTLSEATIGTQLYANPTFAQQASGPTPLLSCENDFRCIGFHAPQIASPIPLDGGPGKFYGAWMHDGTVYLTTSTELHGSGAAKYWGKGHWEPIKRRNGVAYFGVTPDFSGGFSASVAQQGYVAVQGQNMIYPSIAIDGNGNGAIGVTLSGPDYYPSAAYIPFTVGESPTIVRVAGAGVGPDDGFTGTADGGYRPRWGDYGAATVAADGTIWFASEYIAQRCGSAEFNADPTCGFTRGFFGNWSTHIASYRP
jgi:hypothetical protein